MKPSQALLALPALFAAGLATPVDDMRSLRTTCLNAANVVNTSLNTTSNLNTSEIIQSLGYQIGASSANLWNNTASSTAPPKVPWSTNLSSDAAAEYDNPYLNYIETLNVFSEAVARRGKVFHDESNEPVYVALQGLAGAVHTYGLRLRDDGTISRTATIKTISAGSYIIQAQSVWANNRSYPRRVRVRRPAMTDAGDV